MGYEQPGASFYSAFAYFNPYVFYAWIVEFLLLLSLSRYARYRGRRGHRGWQEWALLPPYEMSLIIQKLAAVLIIVTEYGFGHVGNPCERTYSTDRIPTHSYAWILMLTLLTFSLYNWAYLMAFWYLCAQSGGSKSMILSVTSALIGGVVTSFIQWGEFAGCVSSCTTVVDGHVYNSRLSTGLPLAWGPTFLTESLPGPSVLKTVTR